MKTNFVRWVAPPEMVNLVVRADDWRDGWIHQQMQITVTPANDPRIRDICNLISAAPDMLAALLAFERAWREFRRENPTVNMGAFSQTLYLTAVAMQIAKPDGGE